MNDLKKRILEISYKHRLSHLGSCLTAVDIIDSIYHSKKAEDLFVLSSGHAGLALYVVLEKYEGKNAEDLLKRHGIHPNRNLADGLCCSSGSLGHGLPIAVGMALGYPGREIHCLISDGECAEGSIWEAFSVLRRFNISNITVHVNINGWSAYAKVDGEWLEKALMVHAGSRTKVVIHQTNVEQLPFLKGNDAHYHIMSSEDYRVAMQ